MEQHSQNGLIYQIRFKDYSFVNILFHIYVLFVYLFKMSFSYLIIMFKLQAGSMQVIETAVLFKEKNDHRA